MLGVRNDPSVPLNDLATVRAWAEAFTAERPHNFVIGPPHAPRTLRWYAVPRNPVGGVYIHRWLRSDDNRAKHDHPWDNRTWLLGGEYLEHMADGTVIHRKEGDIIERLAAEFHQIELIPGTPPPLTLFFTGPILRDWGFDCPQEWRIWHKFVKQNPGGNEEGPGCG